MPKTIPIELSRLAINTIKMLAVDAVEKAKSGHPGLPMGAADYAFVLWSRYLRFNPHDPAWPNRDRFILSAGHGSMLLYALLHLAGYDLPLEELKRFRQWGSKTPGHPEYGLTPGVETTTGPLGQGFANGVGMAIAAKMAAARYNTAELKIVDHYIYGIVSDGDLMEGVASEAASLAGHLGLGNLIYFYDDNRISIEGSTEPGLHRGSWQALRGLRLAGAPYRWPRPGAGRAGHRAGPGRHRAPHADRRAHPHRAWAAPTRWIPPVPRRAAGRRTKWPPPKPTWAGPQEPTFYVPDEVRQLFADRVAENRDIYNAWQDELAAWATRQPGTGRPARSGPGQGAARRPGGAACSPPSRASPMPPAA